MPRHRLAEPDSLDLVEYLGCVGRDLDPGVTAHSVQRFAGASENAGAAALVVHTRDREGEAPGPLGVQASAYIAAQILIEALKRAGTHATREGRIAALEGLRDFEAGPAPRVTFARNRRTGALGASLLRMNPASGAPVRAPEWIEVVP